VCLSVITITKTIVDGFVPNVTGRFLGAKERPSSCFVTIGKGMWKQRSGRIIPTPKFHFRGELYSLRVLYIKFRMHLLSQSILEKERE